MGELGPVVMKNAGGAEIGLPIMIRDRPLEAPGIMPEQRCRKITSNSD
jgi:hypothetical protein